MIYLKYTAVLFFVILSFIAVAQPYNYYNSQQYQTNQYKSLSNATQKAYSVPDRPYTSSSSYSSPSGTSNNPSSSAVSPSGNIAPATGPGSNGYANIGADEKIKRQEEAGRRNEERYKTNMANLAAAEAKYWELISGHGNAKTAEDHYDLLLTGMRAGIDVNAIFNVIGRNIEGYKAKFGTDPNKPYKSGASVAYDAYADAMQKEINKLLAENSNSFSRAYLLKELVKVKPSFVNYYTLGQTCLINYQYADAYEAFWRAHMKEPQHFSTLVGYGDALIMLGNAVEAEKEYKKAIVINGANADLLLKTAWACFMQNKEDDAYALAKAAAVLIPEDAGPYLFLATLFPEGKDREELLNNANAVQNKIKKASLTQMLMSYAKWLQENNATEISIMYLDLAVATDPKNIDCIEMRYGTNKKLNRQKQAAVDEEILNKL